MIIKAKELTQSIKKEVEEVDNSIIIISAFCKMDALEFIQNSISANVREKKILLRWRLSDIKAKATDIDIYNYCKMHGWELYINFDIHAKIYLFNRLKCIIGSSNLTSSGFNLYGSGNIEMNTMIFIENEEVNKIMSLFDTSYKMTDSVYEKMIKILNDEEKFNQSSSEWGNEINDIVAKKDIKFFSYELLDSKSINNLSNHDIELLGLNENSGEQDIKQAFIRSKIYKWIQINIENECYFGELSCKLHSDMLDDPSVYRKSVKAYIGAILNFISELRIEEFIVDRPRYSQRIRRVK